MTHVVVVVDSPTFGGAETYVAHLAGHLPHGHRCTVVAAEPVPRQLTAALAGRADLVRVDPVGRCWRRLPALRRSLRALDPDVVHVNLVDPSANRVAVAAAASTGVPASATVHMTGSVGSGLRPRVLAALYGRLHAVIVVSEEIAWLVSAAGVDPRRVHVIDNGVPPVAAPCRRRQGGDTLRICGVGRLTAQKGFDVLLDAVGRLVAEGRPVDVVVAGEGRDGEALRAAAGGLPVTFAGFVDDVAGLLATVDVFCLPSRAEGLPLALLEALAAGVPAVATAVGGIPGAVGDAVLLVPPGDADALADALRQIADHPGLREQLARRGRRLAADRFTVERMAQATAAVWDALR